MLKYLEWLFHLILRAIQEGNYVHFYFKKKEEKKETRIQ